MNPFDFVFDGYYYLNLGWPCWVWGIIAAKHMTLNNVTTLPGWQIDSKIC